MARVKFPHENEPPTKTAYALSGNKLKKHKGRYRLAFGISFLVNILAIYALHKGLNLTTIIRESILMVRTIHF